MQTMYVLQTTSKKWKWEVFTEAIGCISQLLLSNKPPQLTATYDNKHLFSYPEVRGLAGVALLQLHICTLAGGLSSIGLQVMESGQAHRSPRSSDTSWLSGACNIMMTEMQ